MQQPKKKIFIATGVYPPESGGPATYTKLMEERLPGHGFVVSVLPFRSVRHLPKLVRHIAYFFKAVAYARRADIVYAQDTMSVGLPAMLAAKLTGKLFLVRVPGDYVWEQGRQRWGVKETLHEFRPELYGWRVRFLHALQAATLRRAAKVVAPSSYLADIVEKWGVPRERIAVIHNGIELPVPAVSPRERPEGFLAVSVGRLVPWKGMDGLVRVVAQEPAWQCVIVDEGPEEGNLQALARELGSKDRIHFVGRQVRAGALGWVKAASAFVLNSTYEGLSHLLIEAMSLGVPIVATNIGGNPELVRDGMEGWLIPPNDDQALHAALQKIEADPHEAARRAAAAAARAREFTIERTIDQLLVLLQTI